MITQEKADRLMLQASYVPDELKKIMDDTELAIAVACDMSSDSDAGEKPGTGISVGMQLMRLDLLTERYASLRDRAENLISRMESILSGGDGFEDGASQEKKKSIRMSIDLLRQSLLVIASQTEKVEDLKESLEKTGRALSQSRKIKQSDLAIRLQEALKKT